MSKILGPYIVTTPTSKKVPLAAGGDGFTTIADGELVGYVTIEINVEKLCKRFAHKIMHSKSHRATLAGGAIRLQATRVRRKPS